MAANGVVDAASIVAAVATILGIVGPGRAWFNRTVGRRFDLYRRFERLGVGAHQSFFETVIGEGPAIRRKVTADLPDYTGDDVEHCMITYHLTEALWVDPLFYAQTLSDEDGTVLGFSVTTRVKRFAPRFAAPRPVPTSRWLLERLTRGKHVAPALTHVRLGRTRFATAVADDAWGIPKCCPPEVRS